MPALIISPERVAVLQEMSYEQYLTTPEWQATRKRIVRRDNNQCQKCHATNNLEVRHYTYERLRCELDEDLVTLCHDCQAPVSGIVIAPDTSTPFISR